MKLNPKSVEARSLLGAVYNQQAMALLQQGNLDAARQALEAGLQAKGDAAVTEALRNNMGCLYVREDKLDQAVGTWQEVIRQNPDMPQAHYNLALLYYTRGDYQAASREFFALKGIDRDMAGELSDYRFRIRTSTEVTPPVKTMITFKGSPLLTKGTVLSSDARSEMDVAESSGGVPRSHGNLMLPGGGPEPTTRRCLITGPARRRYSPVRAKFSRRPAKSPFDKSGALG